MKRKNKLTLHRETLALLDRARLDPAVGGVTHVLGSSCCPDSIQECTNSCQTVCWGCDPPTGKETNCECW